MAPRCTRRRREVQLGTGARHVRYVFASRQSRDECNAAGDKRVMQRQMPYAIYGNVYGEVLFIPVRQSLCEAALCRDSEERVGRADGVGIKSAGGTAQAVRARERCRQVRRQIAHGMVEACCGSATPGR